MNVRLRCYVTPNTQNSFATTLTKAMMMPLHPNNAAMTSVMNTHGIHGCTFSLRETVAIGTPYRKTRMLASAPLTNDPTIATTPPVTPNSGIRNHANSIATIAPTTGDV